MNERVVKNPNFKNNGDFHRSLAARGKGAKDWPNTHTEVEHLGGGKFGASLTVGHRIFFDKADGNKPKKHKLTDERPGKGYVLIQSAKCAVEVYPYYAKYFDVQHEEVRLYEERWVVQRLFKEPDEWRDVDAYNPVISVEEYPEPAGDVVKVAVTYNTDYGVLTVEYFQRDGNALKYNVSFKNTSGSTETFRVIQRWGGIVAAECNGETFPLDTDEPFLAFRKADGKLAIAVNLQSMIFNEDRSEKLGQCLQRPISIEAHAQGMKADFIYGDWVLAQDEMLEIDPDTATLDAATEDGYVGRFGGSQEICAAATITRTNYTTTTQWGGRGDMVSEEPPISGHFAYRAYYEWDVSGIDDDAVISDTVFKYHGSATAAHYSEINPLTEGAPSGATDANLWAYIASGTAYKDPFNVELGAQKEVDLGASADSDLEDALGDDWFAIGFQSPGDECPVKYAGDVYDGTYSSNHGPADPKPTLYVEYTSVEAPTVTTQAADDIEDTTATLNGTVTDDGGATIDYYGFVWDTGADQGDPGDVDPSGPAGTWDFGWKSGEGDYGENPFDHGITGLPSGTTIYFRAAAHNSAGWVYGASRSFLTKPAAPTGVAATTNLPDKVTVTWNKSTGATGYQVYRDGSPLGWLGNVATKDDTGAGAPTITPGTAAASKGTYTGYVRLTLSGEGTNNGATHTYKVRAKNATGESVDSGTNTGYRKPGTLSKQWQRDSGDISGATTDPYNDTGADTPGTPNTMSAPSASTNHSDYVTIGWSAPSCPNGTTHTYRCKLNADGCAQKYSTTDTGYRGAYSVDKYEIKRDTTQITNVATGVSYNDTGADPPTITPGNAVAGDGSSTAYVPLSISGEGTNNGTTHSYTIRAHNAAGWASSFSTGKNGYRAPGSLTYQWQRSAADSNADYGNIAGTTEAYNDTGAPAPTVTPGDAAASDGTHIEYVALSLSGQSANIGEGRYYRCVLNAAGCTQQITGVNRGYRGVGALTYQWQRSEADDEVSYVNIIGATTAAYNDTEAPADGSGRYFKCVLNATDATEQTSSSDRGYRKVIGLENKSANMGSKMVAAGLI